jgi:hypothetical protein
MVQCLVAGQMMLATRGAPGTRDEIYSSVNLLSALLSHNQGGFHGHKKGHDGG